MRKFSPFTQFSCSFFRSVTEDFIISLTIFAEWGMLSCIRRQRKKAEYGGNHADTFFKKTPPLRPLGTAHRPQRRRAHSERRAPCGRRSFAERLLVYAAALFCEHLHNLRRVPCGVGAALSGGRGDCRRLYAVRLLRQFRVQRVADLRLLPAVGYGAALPLGRAVRRRGAGAGAALAARYARERAQGARRSSLYPLLLARRRISVGGV